MFHLGYDDSTVHCRTFLGHLLNIGDTVTGLDLRNCNVNNQDLELMNTDKVTSHFIFRSYSIIFVVLGYCDPN